MCESWSSLPCRILPLREKSECDEILLNQITKANTRLIHDSRCGTIMGLENVEIYSVCVSLVYALINILYNIICFTRSKGVMGRGMKLLYSSSPPGGIRIKMIWMETSSSCHSPIECMELYMKRKTLNLCYSLSVQHQHQHPPLAHNFHLYSHTES